MIVIGLGSGRCGTTSLTKLLNSQEILSFCGIAPEKQVLAGAHIHKSTINSYDQ